MKSATRSGRLTLKGYTNRRRPRCVGCRRQLVGPGERCADCQAELRARRKWR
jgi:predicted amidophosphoribosyltransferase